MASQKPMIPVERIEGSILLIRGHKVMLDAALAELYGVSPKRLNEAVHRNIKRFPADFMFQLTWEETDSLRSQFATLKRGRGQHRKYLAYAFTEQKEAGDRLYRQRTGRKIRKARNQAQVLKTWILFFTLLPLASRLLPS
jgi:hypothetical protein